MERYILLKWLIKEAHRMADAYAGKDLNELVGQPELCMAMARNSFVAHSVHKGYDRIMVEQVADYVFPSHSVCH